MSLVRDALANTAECAEAVDAASVVAYNGFIRIE
jgi:hypothetical protein